MYKRQRLHLTRLLGLCTGETVWIKSNRNDKAGWIMVEEKTTDGFSFNTAITWLFSRQKTTSVNTNVATAVSNTGTDSVETSA